MNVKLSVKEYRKLAIERWHFKKLYKMYNVTIAEKSMRSQIAVNRDRDKHGRFTKVYEVYLPVSSSLEEEE